LAQGAAIQQARQTGKKRGKFVHGQLLFPSWTLL